MAVDEVEERGLQWMLVDVALEEVRVGVPLAQLGGLLDGDRIIEADELPAEGRDDAREPPATAAGVEDDLPGEVLLPQVRDPIELELVLIAQPVVRGPLVTEGIRVDLPQIGTAPDARQESRDAAQDRILGSAARAAQTTADDLPHGVLFGDDQFEVALALPTFEEVEEPSLHRPPIIGPLAAAST